MERKDRHTISVLGVGFLGYGPYKTQVGKVHTSEYRTWRNMLNRCYSDSFKSRNPSYKDCFVCDEWLNFQNFAKWYNENHPNDGGRYFLDKDIISKGNRVYSPESCVFVTPKDNSSESNKRTKSKVYKVISPDGLIYEGKNIAKLARDNDLNYSNIKEVIRGKRKHHKGWRLLTEEV